MNSPEDLRHCTEITTVGPVTVVRFPRETVLSGLVAEAVGRQLTALLTEQGRSRLLLDFANVEGLNSLILGKLVRLNHGASLAGGRLALCSLRPDVRDIMEVTQLIRVLHVYPGEQEALASF